MTVRARTRYVDCTLYSNILYIKVNTTYLIILYLLYECQYPHVVLCAKIVQHMISFAHNPIPPDSLNFKYAYLTWLVYISNRTGNTPLNFVLFFGFAYALF